MTTIMANGYAFDWRALKRWHMNENMLPSGSLIAYKEKDFWGLYKTYIIVGSILILLETSLIIGLITNRRKRRKAESNLLYLNDSLEKLIDERTRELQTAKDMLEELNRQLDFTARVDALTGLYNRRHMEERLKEECEVFKRTGQDFSVMLVDIDDFKQINDVYGHDAGDSVLKTVSNMLRELVRDYDVVSRWGGEEFLLLFPNLAKSDATGRAETIKAAVQAYQYTYNENLLHITVTVGVASFGQYDTTDSVIKRADNAMYQGKNMGKNKVVAAQA
jgi:diguanylate cyclase (GGDEF)-like protein